MAHSFRYVRFKTTQGIGYGLFFINWNKVDKKITYSISASFCNPNDEFHKSKAREFAANRITSPAFTISGTYDSEDPSFVITNNDFSKMLPTILDGIAYSPGWARRALKKGNSVKFGLSRKNPPVKI